MPSTNLGSTSVSNDSQPYVIAEIGVNHGNSMDKAKELIELAKEGGANAAKFQTYKANKIASTSSPHYWDLSKEPTTSQFKLFQKFDHFNEPEYVELHDHCKEVGIDFISTPFDIDAVDFLNPLMPFFKVASADINNVPMLRHIAEKGKPVVLSTGASTLNEIDFAVRELQERGCPSVVLLHCILNYPTDYAQANLKMISGLRRTFPDHVIGYSDHTLPDPQMVALTTAVLLGARVIEKHFTYDKSIKGNDHFHSMDVADLKTFHRNLQFITGMLGDETRKVIASERESRKYARRSIVLNRNVAEGEVLDEGALICKRPGTGIGPEHWDEIVGARTARRLEADHILRWSDLARSE